MPDNNLWVPIIDAISNGFVKILAAMKDLALVLVAIYTTYTQSINSGKLEAVAAKQDVAVSKIDESSQQRSRIEKGVDTNVKAWKAYTTKDPEDVNVAARALGQHENMP